MSEQDQAFMLQAIELARQGRGYVSPNPLVGCVIVQEGRIIGRGYHARFGEAHAEVMALEDAGEAARGATMYVTLEPCCHQGEGKKTPPCAPRVIEAGLARVVVAMQDPNPRVVGGGVAALRAAGVAVDVGVCEDKARALNPGFLSLMERGRPWVLAKWAMTLDGKIATASGDSKWITSEEARVRGHVERGAHDALMVGVGTVLADDPMLNNRSGEGAQPVRVVVDPRLETPPTSKLVQSAASQRLLVLTLSDDAEKRSALEALGAEVAMLNADDNGHIAWSEILQFLAKRNLSSLMIEGGSSLLGSAFDAQVVDEVMVFVAPKVIGGKNAPSPVAGAGSTAMADVLELGELAHEAIGPDIILRGRLKR